MPKKLFVFTKANNFYFFSQIYRVRKGSSFVITLSPPKKTFENIFENEAIKTKRASVEILNCSTFSLVKLICLLWLYSVCPPLLPPPLPPFFFPLLLILLLLLSVRSPSSPNFILLIITEFSFSLSFSNILNSLSFFLAASGPHPSSNQSRIYLDFFSSPLTVYLQLNIRALYPTAQLLPLNPFSSRLRPRSDAAPKPS